jgi:hypothetical protein
MTDLTFVKYQVTIKRFDSQPVVKREWVRVADTGNKSDNGPLYDYATYPSTQTVETEILKQEIQDEQLDIKAIIKAINGI